MAAINFNEVYTTYYRNAFLFAKSYVHDDLVAEDIVSEAIIYLWEVSKKEEIKSIEALLITYLRHKSLNYLHHLQIREDAREILTAAGQRELEIRISTLEACDPQELLSEELRQRIISLINSLPERTREVFELNRLEEKTYQEISDQLGISVKGVEYHISKALKILRENLKDYYFLLFLYHP